MNILKDMYFADPDTKSNYSIKKILPVLALDISYKDKDIHIKKDLLIYWELDTYILWLGYLKSWRK